MACTFRCFAIKHAACMMNMISGKYWDKLVSPFMLVHGVRPDPRTWLPIFLLCYFHHKKDSDALQSKNQPHTLDGRFIRRSSTSNAILLYNSQNQHYYKPDNYILDAYCLPLMVYPTIIYNGRLFVLLHQDKYTPTSEPHLSLQQLLSLA